jgi:hypothetical protein
MKSVHVIPAKAGIQRNQPHRLFATLTLRVALTGVQRAKRFCPAFAGMTAFSDVPQSKSSILAMNHVVSTVLNMCLRDSSDFAYLHSRHDVLCKIRLPPLYKSAVNL